MPCAKSSLTIASRSMHPICPRCGFHLQPIDDAPPPFCGQCGLAQLRVSPDAHAYPVPAGTATAPVAGTAPASSDIDWPKALRYVAVAALLGVGPPAAIPGALTSGGLGGPTLLLTPALTLVLISVYHQTRPRRTINAAIGARIGALLGLVMGALVAFVAGTAGFILRYHYGSHQVDDKIQEAMAQLPTQLTTGPMPPELAGFLQSSEFRAGSFLMSHVFFALLLILVGCICGWIAGSMLRARRDRHLG